MTAVAAGDELLKGGTSGGGGTTTPRQQQPPPPPPEQGLRCPRCDSPNTKLCYYNNYSLSQPRHFCKTCRRYWTKGGTLRNIPIGGGCRRNKRSRSTTSRVSLNLRSVTVNASIDQQQSSTRLGRFLGGGGAMVMSSPIGGVTSADYQPGAAAGSMPPPRLNIPAVGQYVPFVEWSSGPTAVDLTGGGGNSSAAAAMRSTIASFIESQSFINQDLHWKLQRQRLSTVSLAQPTSSAAGHTAPRRVGAGAFMQISAGAPVMEPMPTVTSWIMDSSCVFLSPPQPANTTSAVMATNTPNCNINSGLSSGDHATFNNSCDVGTIPTWGNIYVDVYNATVKHGDDQDGLRLGRLILKE